MSTNNSYRDDKGRFVNDPSRPRDVKGRFLNSMTVIEPIIVEAPEKPKGALDAKVGDKAWLIVTVISGKKLEQPRKFIWEIVSIGSGMVKFMGDTLNETYPISGFGSLWGFADENTRESWMDCKEFYKWFECGMKELFETYRDSYWESSERRYVYFERRVSGGWRVLKDRQWWYPHVSSDPNNKVWALEAWGAWVGDRCIADRNHHGQFEVFENGDSRHYYGNSSDQNRVIDKINWALRHCGYSTRIKRQ